MAGLELESKEPAAEPTFNALTPPCHPAEVAQIGVMCYTAQGSRTGVRPDEYIPCLSWDHENQDRPLTWSAAPSSIRHLRMTTMMTLMISVTTTQLTSWGPMAELC